MKGRLKMIALACAALAVAGVALASYTPGEAAKLRIERYRDTGAAFKSVNDQLKSGTLIKVMLRASAKTISASARDQFNWFPPGSGPEAGVKTKAKPEIWSEADKFREAQLRFQNEADAFSAAVESGDKDAIRKQSQALGKACAGCHDKYRVRH